MGGLLRQPNVSMGAEMLPCDFQNAQGEHPWPYSRFDGRYEDRALHLATRCCDIKTVAALLRCGADPRLENDNEETALNIALGFGEKWDHAFLAPRSFGGNTERIAGLLNGSEPLSADDLMTPPDL